MKEKKTGEKARKKNNWRNAMRIFRYLAPQKWVFLLGMAFLFISSFVSLIVPRVMGQMAGMGMKDQVTENPMALIGINFDFNNLKHLLYLLSAIFVLQGMVSFFRVYLFAVVTEKMMLTLRNDTYRQIIQMPMSWFHERRIGDLNSRLSADITTIKETFTTTLAELIRQTVVILFGVLALFYFSSRLAFVMLASIPPIVIAAAIFGRFIRRLGKDTQKEVADSNIVVEETLTGIVNVKAFTNEEFESNRYDEKANSILKIAMKAATWRGLFSTFIIVFVFGAIAIVLYQGAVLTSEGVIQEEEFFTFLLYTVMIGGSFGGIASQYAALQRGLGSIDSVMNILDEKPEELDWKLSKSASKRLLGEITFEKLHFEYESRPDIPVLHDISFTIHPGEQVAVVGPSGAGKSTLAALIINLYKPTKGRLLFDNKPASAYELSFIRSQIAYVPQEVILFGGTIKENIEYGRPGATEKEIYDAAQKANTLEFIEKFPEGMNTIVGERGIQLSGGQRQRIAIARAVLRDPSILILDEATSSLDSESEQLVQEALEKLMKGRSSLVIAHRLSTIKNANKILVLENGILKEWGTHQDLIAKDEGIYRNLSVIQNG